MSHFKDLKFDEPSHTYTVNGVKYPSVSSLIKNFYEEFDSSGVAPVYASRRGFNEQQVIDAWLGEGKIASDKGHRVHLFGEDYVKWRYFGMGEEPKVSCKQTLGIVDFWNNFPDYLVPVATELQMYSEEYGYSGTADIIAKDKRDDSLLVLDYKGLDVNTPVFTTDGWKTMGTIQKGDTVYDKNGNPTEVVATSDVKYKKCYKIKFDNNEEVIADFEHRWDIVYDLSRNRKIKTTEELYHELQNIPKSSNGTKRSHRIPKIKNTLPLENEEIDLPIDPYVLGIWLADGSKACGVVTNPLKEVWDEVSRRGYTFSEDLQSDVDDCPMRTIYDIRTELRKMNLLMNKHLPDIYLKCSIQQRLDLLRGFMDGDGYYHPTRKRFVMSTTSLAQVDALVKITGSLGIKCTVLPVDKKLNGKVFKAFDVCFSTNELNPFLVRNQDIEFSSNRSNTYRRIDSIEPVETVPTRCIEVDSLTHTFLFGRSFIPTHNTNKEILEVGKPPLYHIPQEYSLTQNNLGKYALQFSFYQNLLQLKGYPVKGRVLIWLNEDKDNKKLYRTFKTPDLVEPLKSCASIWSPKLNGTLNK